MIDPNDRGDMPILRCPKCSTLFGPKMTECSNCGGPLVPAAKPKIQSA